MDKKCDCGGKLIECKIFSGITYLQTVSVPNGYNFPKNMKMQNYICEICGRIYSYGVEFNDKKEKQL